MPLTLHSLRQKLRDARQLTGVFSELPCLEAVEIIGLASYGIRAWQMCRFERFLV